jgi:hypothetical protein
VLAAAGLNVRCCSVDNDLRERLFVRSASVIDGFFSDRCAVLG